MDDLESIVPRANVFMIRHYAENSADRLEYLKNNLPWIYDEPTSRRFCNMGSDYLVFDHVQQAQQFDALVLKVMQELNERFGVAMNACYANYYEDGNSIIPFRKNEGLQTDLDQPMLSIAYGGTRQGIFKDIDTEEEHEFFINGGDLCIMGLNSQKNYLHGMRASNTLIEPFISLTFRKISSWSST